MAKDLFGQAILDYHNGNYSEDLVTSTSISEDDILKLPYLFRGYSDMPKLEQKALQLAKGKILDIGCGAGSHSLYLHEKGFEVKSIDISEGAIDTCKKRGLKHAEVLDFKDETDTFDTILLLMNGSGVFETLSQAPYFFIHLKHLLNPNGQIFIDSSDIKYMYDSDEGQAFLNEIDHYYGELTYYITYKGQTEAFPWMYLDFQNLQRCCKVVGLNCELVLEGPHFDYLARITPA